MPGDDNDDDNDNDSDDDSDEMQKHKYDIVDTNLMTILTFVFVRAGAWAGLRGAYQGIRQIFAFFNQKNVLSTSPKLYISISIFSSNEDSPYFQAQLHALSLFLGSLLPQVENNCVYCTSYYVMCQSFTAKRCE